MLARKGKYYVDGGLVLETPLLIPSFSSKGFTELKQLVRVMAEFITDAVLVSAYDIHYKLIDQKALSFSNIVFLDSGGYEARVDYDLGEAYRHKYTPEKWTQGMHRAVLDRWPKNIPCIVVTFDSPRRADHFKEQLKRASTLQRDLSGIPVEFLVKPESRNSAMIPINSIVDRAAQLRNFTAIGMTEKECGSSFLQRLENIARLRTALDEAEIKAPIHIFGSLDAFTTPLYFLAGAEIFDGLTWLRFGYHGGATVYGQNYAALRELDWLRRDTQDLTSAMWKNNYYYLQSLRDKMISFAKSGDYDIFEDIGPHLKRAGDALTSRLERA